MSSLVEPPVVTARAERGTIEVEGTFTTPCAPCYRLHAEALREPKASGARIQITLDVVATTETRSTLGMVGPYGYRATINNLSPGAYDLSVLHTIKAAYDTAPPRRSTVLERVISVP